MPLLKDDPKSVGDYQLVDRLGAGGMGVVYWGRSRSGRDVAVKVVHAQYAEDAVFRARFRQEIKAVRQVSGAFTAPVVDADPDAVRPWMATQYVPGSSLAQRIRDHGALHGTELRRLALGLVEALRDIHGAGVVHRDLKPANVLMAEDGPRVIDFGISRAVENHTALTETGQMIGTPPFMSPEQLTDARMVGFASDVFSLGALLVYAATGHGPFDADSPYLTAYRVVHDEPVLDGLGRPIRAVLARCLAKEAGDRPGLDELAREFAAALPEPTADELARALRQDTPTLTAPTGSGTDTGTDTRTGPTAPPPTGRRHRVRPLPAAIATVGALVLGLTAYLLIGPGRAQSGSDASPAWRTTVYETSPRGARQPLDGAGGGTGEPGCAAYGGDVYCAGGRILPVRLDGRTGRTVWRAATASSGSGENTYSATILGIRDHTVLVRQTVGGSPATERTSVVALDTGTGDRLWSRAVDKGGDEAGVFGDLVLLPDGDGRSVTARSPRTGAERWTAALPKGQICVFAPEVETGLYLECVADTLEEAEDSLVVALDPADGSQRRLAVPYHSDLVGVWDGTLVLLEWGEGTTSDGDTPYTRIVQVAGDGSSTTTTVPEETYRGTATLAGGALWFATSGGEVTAVSPLTGEALWQTRTGLKQPGPVRYDTGTRTGYLASADGRVAALDAREGTLLWDSVPRAERVPSDSPPEHPVLLNDGALVVAAGDGGVFSLDPAQPDRGAASG